MLGLFISESSNSRKDSSSSREKVFLSLLKFLSEINRPRNFSVFSEDSAGGTFLFARASSPQSQKKIEIECEFFVEAPINFENPKKKKKYQRVFEH